MSKTETPFDPHVVYVPEAEREAPEPASWISKTPDVCGGDACIRRMRIPVWLLVEMRQRGATDAEFFNNYPLITPADLAASWEYYARNKEEIDEAIRQEQEA
jgi:uncharacterized protein (DUF433 family)